MGHYAGLVHLGKEAMNARDLPLHATPSCLRFLRDNGPWSQLVSNRNVAPSPLLPDRPLRLAPGLTIEAVAVPHRAEFSDTVAFLIRGPARSLFYCPDIDAWRSWDRDLRQFLAGVDIALLDGTFCREDEVPDRNLKEIPHPPVFETAEMLRGSDAEVRFIHLNHTNPLYRDSPERRRLRELGFDAARQGQSWEL